MSREGGEGEGEEEESLHAVQSAVSCEGDEDEGEDSLPAMQTSMSKKGLQHESRSNKLTLRGKCETGETGENEQWGDNTRKAYMPCARNGRGHSIIHKTKGDNSGIGLRLLLSCIRAQQQQPFQNNRKCRVKGL